MPEKAKSYDRVIFTPEAIRGAVSTLINALPEKHRKLRFENFSIELPKEKWSYDNEEEFFSDYLKGFKTGLFVKDFDIGAIRFVIYWQSFAIPETTVTIKMPARADVEKVFNALEPHVEKCRLPEPPQPPPKKKDRPKIKVFIGHGRNPQWRDLKDHLHEKHGLDVEAYESGARAGLTIRDVLDDMLTSSSFAILVLTGEDLDAEGHFHARENVIHELGLFQGRLGWRKAIALLEDGVTEFSNIHGLNQIRFNKGNIQETFGEVLATVKREFSEDR